MDVAVDSNILVFLADPRSPFHRTSNSATMKLASGGDGLFVFPQNLIEFWAVATRPISSNGLGFSIPQAKGEIARIKSLFQLIPETPDIYPEWQRLVVEFEVLGKNVHDARIAAQMSVNNIDNILTFNSKDFVRFSNINVIEPESF